MSNKSINVFGLVGIFIIIIGTILNIINDIKVNAISSLYISLIFTLGFSFLFISLYNWFKFTEHSPLGCKINLIGVFSTIPIVAFNIFRFITKLFPSLSVCSTSTILLSTFFIVNNILLTLFLFNIYNNRTTYNLANLPCKLTLVLSVVLLIANTIYHVIYTINNIFHVNLRFVTEISICYNFISLIFQFTFLITYSKFLDELKSISSITTEDNLYATV